MLKNPASEAPTADDFADALDHLELQAEHAQAMAQDSPDVFIKAAMNVAAMDFFTVLNRFDTITLSKRLEEKPKLYFQLMDAQCKLMKASLEQQKFEFRKEQAKARQREREQKLRTRKPILLSDATLATFNRVATAAPTSEPEIPIRELQPTNHERSSTIDFAVPYDRSAQQAQNGGGVSAASRVFGHFSSDINPLIHQSSSFVAAPPPVPAVFLQFVIPPSFESRNSTAQTPDLEREDPPYHVNPRLHPPKTCFAAHHEHFIPRARGKRVAGLLQHRRRRGWFRQPVQAG